MDAERWRKIEQLCHAALECGPRVAQTPVLGLRLVGLKKQRPAHTLTFMSRLRRLFLRTAFSFLLSDCCRRAEL